MAIIIVLAIAIIISIFIVIPFFSRSHLDNSNHEEETNLRDEPLVSKWKKLNSEKETLYDALKDIEFDYGLGKLSKDDYEDLTKTYRVKAASVLKQLDDINQNSNISSVEEEIEKEISERRQFKKERDNRESRTGDVIDSEVNRKIKLNCSKCRKECSPEDKFCSDCGNKLIDNEFIKETTDNK
ncbi:hypothetical protein MYX76_07965 [Desulfobacterota bacterium AH_259_B03_O07]|nr:hypothetical protein [Desulfobacterota bacterium AH_259_B03_O07]